MTIATNAAESIVRRGALKVKSLDRVNCNVYQPQGQTSGGIAV